MDYLHHLKIENSQRNTPKLTFARIIVPGLNTRMQQTAFLFSLCKWNAKKIVLLLYGTQYARPK